MDLSEVRRKNALALMHENALDELSFALCLGVDEGQIGLLLADSSKRKIADSLARLMEQTFSKSVFWLDEAEKAASFSGYDLFG